MPHRSRHGLNVFRRADLFGEEQMQGELEVYNPLIPQGNELIATLMLEIEDVKRRERELYRLAGIEESAFIELNQERFPGVPAEYDERTTPDGKTSSVHWVRFKFIPEQVAKFKDPSVEAVSWGAPDGTGVIWLVTGAPL